MDISIRREPCGALLSASSERPSTLTVLLRHLRIWIQRARSRQALEELDERLLQDIGVSHAEARLEAAKHFWTA